MTKNTTSNSDLLILAATAAAVSLVTYKMTLKSVEKAERQKRIAASEEESHLRTQQNQKQVEQGEPKGVKNDQLGIENVYIWELEDLKKRFDSSGEGYVNEMKTKARSMKDSFKGSIAYAGSNQYNVLVKDGECVLAKHVLKPQKNGKKQSTHAYVRAGPREKLHFYPKNVNAAIVTCGGLCPGLNNVIKEVTNTLKVLYGANKVYGIRGGYKGFYESDPLELTPQSIAHIHTQGGTFLGSSRGGFDLDKIINFIKEKNISQLYIVGGDGTHRGAFRIHEGCIEQGLNVAVAGIPKTIDNDIDYIDRCFGFNTAVEASLAAIRSAKVEAMCNKPNGIGIVKLMGRSAGYIAAHATLGSADVDLCLVPEVPIVLEGPTGCLPHVYRRVAEQGYAVIVVAEGAGEELLGECTETDASGNKKLPAIGEFMKKSVEAYFIKRKSEATVKYIDPSYMIRSCAANADDSFYCQQLGQNAVHGTMAGYTGFSVGLCNNKMCMLPIPEMVATSPRHMNPMGRTWERVLARTCQPNTYIDYSLDLEKGEISDSSDEEGDDEQKQ